MIFSEQHRKNLSISHKGKKQSEENISKRVLKLKGKHRTEEFKLKMRLIKLGKPLSEEHKKKLSLAHKGKKAWNKNKKMSEEQKIKISLSKIGKESFHKGKTLKEEYGIERAKQIKLNYSLSRQGKHYSPKTEFKKGNESYGYIDGRSYKPIARRRIKGRQISHIVWCKENQLHRVPDGCMIHHINQNPLDDRPENLQLMTKDFHAKLHSEYLKELKK